jgi:hypothetical protein
VTPQEQHLAGQLFGQAAQSPGLQVSADPLKVAIQGAEQLAAALFNPSASAMSPRGNGEDHAMQQGLELERGGRDM